LLEAAVALVLAWSAFSSAWRAHHFSIIVKTRSTSQFKRIKYQLSQLPTKKAKFAGGVCNEK